MIDRDDKLLWLDLETTGSDPDKDCIIEMGCILTDVDLDELGSAWFLIQPTPEGYGRMMLDPDPTVRDMHASNGLLDALASPAHALKVHEAADGLLRWLEGEGARKGHVVLAGSGVGHFDRRFLARWMPHVDRFMRYWCIDIGVIRRAHEMWLGEPIGGLNWPDKPHRAIQDARLHLEEARTFRYIWRDSLVRTVTR